MPHEVVLACACLDVAILMSPRLLGRVFGRFFQLPYELWEVVFYEFSHALRRVLFDESMQEAVDENETFVGFYQRVD